MPTSNVRIIQPTLNYACPIRTTANQYKATCCWDQECARLKEAHTEALKKEQTTGVSEGKAETVAKKKQCDQQLKMIRK